MIVVTIAIAVIICINMYTATKLRFSELRSRASRYDIATSNVSAGIFSTLQSWWSKLDERDGQKIALLTRTGFVYTPSIFSIFLTFQQLTTLRVSGM